MPLLKQENAWIENNKHYNQISRHVIQAQNKSIENKKECFLFQLIKLKTWAG